MSILILVLVLPTSGQSSKRQVTRDATQVSNWHCLKRRDILLNSDGHLRSFSSSELMERLIDEHPVERPDVLGKNNLRGFVTIQVVIGKEGKVICSRGVKGNPIGIASAIRSLRGWTFKPYVLNGKRKSIVGSLVIPFNFGG
jgi:outer membrane biosynthesis protein TonB